MLPHRPLYEAECIAGAITPGISVLAIGAHPDDVDWSITGLMLLEHQRGRRTAILDLTKGEAGTRGTPELRRKEAIDAAQRLGTSCRLQCDMGDARLTPTLEASLSVAKVIRQLQPTLVITCYPEDKHPDHAAAGVITEKAMFHCKMKRFDLGEPIWSPRALLFYNQHIYRHPDFVVDISSVYEQKVEVAKAFDSQFGTPLTNVAENYRPVGISDYLRLIQTRSAQYGSLIGVEWGEGFMTQSPVRIDDPARVLAGE